MEKGIELKIPQASGIPEGSLISVRVGNTRRQAVHGSNRPLRFPDMHGKRELMRVDVFYPIAQAKLSIETANIKQGHSWSVPLELPSLLQGELRMKSFGAAVRDILALESTGPSVSFAFSNGNGEDGGKDQMLCDMSCEGETEQNGVGNYGHIPKQSAARRHQVAVGESYLQEHQIMEAVRNMLHMLLKDKPINPYEYMSQFIAQSKVGHKDIATDGMTRQDYGNNGRQGRPLSARTPSTPGQPRAQRPTPPLSAAVAAAATKTKEDKLALETSKAEEERKVEVHRQAHEFGLAAETNAKAVAVAKAEAEHTAVEAALNEKEQRLAAETSANTKEEAVGIAKEEEERLAAEAKAEKRNVQQLASPDPNGIHDKSRFGREQIDADVKMIFERYVSNAGGTWTFLDYQHFQHDSQDVDLHIESAQDFNEALKLVHASVSGLNAIAFGRLLSRAGKNAKALLAALPAVAARDSQAEVHVSAGSGVLPSGKPPLPLAPNIGEENLQSGTPATLVDKVFAPPPTAAVSLADMQTKSQPSPAIPQAAGAATLAVDVHANCQTLDVLPLKVAETKASPAPCATAVQPVVEIPVPSSSSTGLQNLAPPPIPDKASSRASSSVVADVFEYPIDNDIVAFGDVAGKAVSDIKEVALEKFAVEVKEDLVEKLRERMRSALSGQAQNGQLPELLSASFAAAAKSNDASPVHQLDEPLHQSSLIKALATVSPEPIAARGPPTKSSDKDENYHEKVRMSLGQKLLEKSRTAELRSILTQRSSMNPQAFHGFLQIEDGEIGHLKTKIREAFVQQAESGTLQQTLEKSNAALPPDGSRAPSQRDEQETAGPPRSRKRQSSWCAEVTALKDETSDVRTKILFLEEQLNQVTEENKKLKEVFQEVSGQRRLSAVGK